MYSIYGTVLMHSFFKESYLFGNSMNLKFEFKRKKYYGMFFLVLPIHLKFCLSLIIHSEYFINISAILYSAEGSQNNKYFKLRHNQCSIIAHHGMNSSYVEHSNKQTHSF